MIAVCFDCGQAIKFEGGTKQESQLQKEGVLCEHTPYRYNAEWKVPDELEIKEVDDL